MALAKQFLKSKPVCKVSFELPTELVNGAKEIALVGDFNQWDASSNLLKKQKTGFFKTTVELPVGQEIQFRYVLDGQTWINDNAADKYVPSPISYEENSVVVL